MPTVVNTELTSGVGQRWVKPVEAEDVADEIVDALEVPRFDVFVPRANGVMYKVLSLIPRGAREALGRLMKIDKLMTEVDHGARRAYEERAAKSEPGLERQRPRRPPHSATPPEAALAGDVERGNGPRTPAPQSPPAARDRSGPRARRCLDEGVGVNHGAPPVPRQRTFQGAR